MSSSIMREEGTTGVHLPPIRIIHRSDLRASDEPGAENRFGKDKRYKPMEGSILLETNYHRDYTQKAIAPTKLIRPERPRDNPGTFFGQPTYRDDYKAHDILQSGGNLPRQFAYRPPSHKFEGTSSYSLEYVPHHVTPFKNAKPAEHPRATDDPFPNATSYRDSFPNYHPVARQRTERPRWQPQLAPMSDVTNYRTDFVPKELAVPASCKPSSGPYASEAPFEGSTTQKSSYVDWKMEKPFLKERASYKTPDGEFDFSTTMRMEYTPKPLDKLPSKRPAEVKVPLEAFNGTTHYETDFPNRPLGERTKSMKKNEYVVPELPFSGDPTYKRDFVQYQVTPRKDYRPNEVPLHTEEPFPTDSQYRDSYGHFQLPEVETRKRPAWQRNSVKLDTTTSYQSDFVRRELVKTESCRPEVKPVHSEEESTDYTTTHVDSFTPWKFVNDEGPRGQPRGTRDEVPAQPNEDPVNHEQ